MYEYVHVNIFEHASINVNDDHMATQYEALASIASGNVYTG